MFQIPSEFSPVGAEDSESEKKIRWRFIRWERIIHRLFFVLEASAGFGIRDHFGLSHVINVDEGE